MATTTTIYDFRAELYDQLVANTDLASASVDINYGEPLDGPRSEVIWLGDTLVTEVERDALRSGRQVRMEEYETTVWLVVASKAKAKQSEERAATLYGYIEDVVVADPSTNPLITDTGVIAVWMTSSEMQTLMDSDGARTIWQITLTTKARLQ